MAELILDLSHLRLHAQGGRCRVSAEFRVACEPDPQGAREAPRATLHLSFSPPDPDEPALPGELLEALEPLADFLGSEGPRAEHRITVRVHVGPEASPETERAADFLLDLPWEELADENGPLLQGKGRAHVKRLLLPPGSAAAAQRIGGSVVGVELGDISVGSQLAGVSIDTVSVGGRLLGAVIDDLGSATRSLDLPHAAPPPATRGLLDDVPSPAAPLCLNAWFPDHPAGPIRLPVGTAALLRVNLGPPREAAASEALPPDVLQALQEVPFIDVLVLCASADITPLRRRLQMPPDPAVILEFTFTPRRPGPLEIQIVLLVHNEPVHRMLVPVEATAPMAASAPGPASP